MVAACEANKVQFMDGVMFMHNERFAKILEVLDAGKVTRPVAFAPSTALSYSMISRIGAAPSTPTNF